MNVISLEKNPWYNFERYEELSDEKKVFQIRSQNQLIFAKTFMDVRFRNRTCIKTNFRLKNHHAISLSQARCLCGIFVNMIFISCHYNNDQMKKLFYQIDALLKGYKVKKKLLFLFTTALLQKLIKIKSTKIWQTHLA